MYKFNIVYIIVFVLKMYICYTLYMKTYTTKEFRENLREALNEVDKGEKVFVERFGQKYVLQAEANIGNNTDNLMHITDEHEILPTPEHLVKPEKNWGDFCKHGADPMFCKHKPKNVVCK